MTRSQSKELMARVGRVLGQAMLKSDPMAYCQYLATTAVENQLVHPSAVARPSPQSV